MTKNAICAQKFHTALLQIPHFCFLNLKNCSSPPPNPVPFITCFSHLTRNRRDHGESTCHGQMVLSSTRFIVEKCYFNLLIPHVNACQTENDLSYLWHNMTSWLPKQPSPPFSYLEWVEACNDTSVFHLTAFAWVSEFAILVRAWACTPLELPAHLEGQPLCVTDLCHV